MQIFRLFVGGSHADRNAAADGGSDQCRRRRKRGREEVSATDALLILQYAVGKIDEFSA